MRPAPRFRSLALLLGALALLPLLLASGRYGEEFKSAAAAHPENPRPGDPVAVAFRIPPSEAAGKDAGAGLPYRVSLYAPSGRRISSVPAFLLDDAHGAAVLAVPNTLGAGPTLVRIEGLPAEPPAVPLLVRGRDFITEEIALNQANTDIRTEADPKKTAESAELWRILSSAGGTIFHPGPFVPPTQATRRTSHFGDRRTYRYTDGSDDRAVHAGIDYGIPRLTPVYACAAGRVVLARFRIVTGYSVVLEHLPGVYSLYYHLDSLDVAEGSTVAAGDLLGKSGSTGLSTGPHLHWELRVHGEAADPDAFVAATVLDKDLIISKINGSASEAQGRGNGKTDR